jgi:DNA uptake protein ComE-like DNA-binding protein
MPRGRAVRAACLAAAFVAPACGLLHRHHEPRAERPIELNSASRRAVESLPGITPSMARRIVDGRPYSTPDDLVDRGILTHHELERILDHIVIPERGH